MVISFHVRSKSFPSRLHPQAAHLNIPKKSQHLLQALQYVKDFTTFKIYTTLSANLFAYLSQNILYLKNITRKPSRSFLMDL
ncbi:unnamed protein product [Cochlearia groenlandica]